MAKRRPKIDKCQRSLFDTLDFTEEKIEILDQQVQIQHQILYQTQTRHISHENHIEDSKLIKDLNRGSNNESDNENNEPNLRSEQIIVSKDNYPTISDVVTVESIDRSIDAFSFSCHKSKNQFNQCLYEMRHAFFGKMDNAKDDIEKKLRIDIRSAMNKFKGYSFEKLKKSNYKNQIYKLLDKYFKDQSKMVKYTNPEYDNYSWSPQSAQQTIDMAVEAWLDNDLARRDWDNHPEHRADYTGKPGIPGYRTGSEYVTTFTNQQCEIVDENINIGGWGDTKITVKSVLNFPGHLGIKSIETRLVGKTDLREVRVIPLVMRGCYKIELVYKKVTDTIKIKSFNLDPKRIVGIDTGQENVLTIANNVGISPIVIKGGVILSINQWFDKIGSKSYSTYYRQQKHKGKESKGVPIVMGEKMRILSSNRINSILDILHKISRYIVNYCIDNRIGTIVWGRNPGWKQNINIGKKNNQKFTKIPHYILFKLLKYKSEEVGIKVIDVLENHTSKCSFPDLETIGHKEKGQYFGVRGKKYPKKLGMAPKGWLGRGLFRTAKGIIINSDVNAAYNMIRKVFPDAFNIFIRNGKLVFSAVGIAGVVLHPERISIKDLLN